MGYSPRNRAESHIAVLLSDADGLKVPEHLPACVLRLLPSGQVPINIVKKVRAFPYKLRLH